MDVDHVITIRELAMWLKEEGIDFNSFEEINVAGKNPGNDYLSLSAVRGMEGIRGATIDVDDVPMKVEFQ